MHKIVLASGSPRRKQLLKQIGIKYPIIHESKYVEDMTRYKDPVRLVQYLALGKAMDVVRHYRNAIIIAADTFIVLRRRFIGKPSTPAEARQMLHKLSGKTHTVISGFAIIHTKTKNIVTGYDQANVSFRKLQPSEIDDYIATGEPLDKAGAYGYQEKGAVLVKKIEGDYYSVVGLPLWKIHVELKKMGVNVLNLK